MALLPFTAKSSAYRSANAYSVGRASGGGSEGVVEPAARLHLRCYRSCKKYVCGGLYSCSDAQLETCFNDCTW